MSVNTEEKIEKSDDKKDIEMEEREKMLNAENKAPVQQEKDEKAGGDVGEDKTTKSNNKSDGKEGMETKPKKIPIGGIQMPGFFTRSKSKDKVKDVEEVEGAELIENQPLKDADPAQTQTTQSRIKLPKLQNPFRKSRLTNEESDGENNKDDQQQQQPKEKKRLLDQIRIPLVNVLQRKKKDENLESQTAQAGLASMETLDEKSTDGKSTIDNGAEMKNVDLTNKDVEKQQPEPVSEEEANWIKVAKAYQLHIISIVLFILVVIVVLAVVLCGPKFPREYPIRNGKFVETVTSCGKVEGLVEDSAVAFRGIPYARPPIGDLRFKYAQPLNNIAYCWNGTFLAHNATENCLQIHSNGTVDGIEDCLTLDVVTPYVRYDNPLPVIVLIGAESFMGGSPGKMRPSARYARAKDVLFVRPNFRMGALGFLALEALSKDDYPYSSGNYGLSDILAALKWVKLNIEHFGGDPDSVTLFGHQAGATIVTALSTMSDASEYFTRAWATSGSAIYPKRTRQESETDNRSFLQMVDCADIECLRKLPAEKLVTGVEDTWRKPQPDLPSKTENPLMRHEWLVLDGRILKEHPATVWAKEQELNVKLVIGTTAHAGASQKLLLKHTNWTEPLVKQHVVDSLLHAKNLSTEALKRYPATYKGLSAMISDVRIVCPLFAIKTQMYRVPFYVVTETRGEHDIADVDSDIDAILGRYEPKTPEQRHYFSSMQNLFYYYIWHGKIEQSEAFAQKVLVVGQDVLPNSTYSHCAFWIQNNIVLPFAALD